MGMSKQLIQSEKQNITKISLRMRNNLFWNVKQLALDQRRSITSLTEEAFTDILTKYSEERG